MPTESFTLIFLLATFYIKLLGLYNRPKALTLRGQQLIMGAYYTLTKYTELLQRYL